MNTSPFPLRCKQLLSLMLATVLVESGLVAQNASPPSAAPVPPPPGAIIPPPSEPPRKPGLFDFLKGNKDDEDDDDDDNRKVPKAVLVEETPAPPPVVTGVQVEKPKKPKASSVARKEKSPEEASAPGNAPRPEVISEPAVVVETESQAPRPTKKKAAKKEVAAPTTENVVVEKQALAPMPQVPPSIPPTVPTPAPVVPPPAALETRKPLPASGKIVSSDTVLPTTTQEQTTIVTTKKGDSTSEAAKLAATQQEIVELRRKLAAIEARVTPTPPPAPTTVEVSNSGVGDSLPPAIKAPGDYEVRSDAPVAPSSKDLPPRPIAAPPQEDISRTSFASEAPVANSGATQKGIAELAPSRIDAGKNSEVQSASREGSPSVEITPEPSKIPVALRTDKPGVVKNPHPPHNEVDVVGLPSGSLARDPATQKVFRVP